MRRKYHWNRDIDAAIVKLYQSTPQRGAVAKFARALGYPQHLISVRALLAADAGNASPQTLRPPSFQQ